MRVHRFVFAPVFPVSSMDGVMRVSKGAMRGGKHKRDEQERKELHEALLCVNECSDKKSVERK